MNEDIKLPDEVKIPSSAALGTANQSYPKEF